MVVSTATRPSPLESNRGVQVLNPKLSLTYTSRKICQKEPRPKLGVVILTNLICNRPKTAY